MATRVDFKHVREHADFDRVLTAYGIELKKDGTKPGQFKALCPFHEDSNPSLKVNTDKNVFHCFACEAKGNVLDFVRDMDGLGDDELRKAALKIVEICGIAPNPGGPVSKAKPPAKPKAKPKAKAKPADDAPPPSQPPAETPTDEELDGELQNRVLTFELKLEQDDALKVWLEERGINHHAQREFGLGRASQRSKTIADRLAIPLHNANGQLVGYCGRYVGDDVPDGEAKYILPGGFRKDFELFNYHRAFGPMIRRYFLVMESYFSVMRHHQELTCISPMGHELSNRQLELLVKRFPLGQKNSEIPRVFVVADGDEPGRDGAARIAGQLATHFWTQTVHLPDGQKPHHLTSDELKALLRTRWKDYR